MALFTLQGVWMCFCAFVCNLCNVSSHIQPQYLVGCWMHACVVVVLIGSIHTKAHTLWTYCGRMYFYMDVVYTTVVGVVVVVIQCNALLFS